MAVGRTVLVHGLFESNDSKAYHQVASFTCTNGYSLVLTFEDTTTQTIDLRTVQSVNIIPGGTEFANNTVASARPAGT